MFLSEKRAVAAQKLPVMLLERPTLIRALGAETDASRLLILAQNRTTFPATWMSGFGVLVSGPKKKIEFNTRNVPTTLIVLGIPPVVSTVVLRPVLTEQKPNVPGSRGVKRAAVAHDQLAVASPAPADRLRCRTRHDDGPLPRM